MSKSAETKSTSSAFCFKRGPPQKSLLLFAARTIVLCQKSGPLGCPAARCVVGEGLSTESGPGLQGLFYETPAFFAHFRKAPFFVGFGANPFGEI
ncbi:MAG: hypothetical protein AAFN09_10100 [Pseudomonadota bacterium]